VFYASFIKFEARGLVPLASLAFAIIERTLSKCGLESLTVEVFISLSFLLVPAQADLRPMLGMTEREDVMGAKTEGEVLPFIC